MIGNTVFSSCRKRQTYSYTVKGVENWTNRNKWHKICFDSGVYHYLITDMQSNIWCIRVPPSCFLQLSFIRHLLIELWLASKKEPITPILHLNTFLLWTASTSQTKDNSDNTSQKELIPEKSRGHIWRWPLPGNAQLVDRTIGCLFWMSNSTILCVSTKWKKFLVRNGRAPGQEKRFSWRESKLHKFLTQNSTGSWTGLCWCLLHNS